MPAQYLQAKKNSFNHNQYQTGDADMFKTRQNYHHSKLPKIGTIGKHPAQSSNVQELRGNWIVESYNLCDNCYPYSVGIHLVNIRSLANTNITDTVSGTYFIQE